MPLRFQPARGASVLISASSRGPTGAAATITAGTGTALAAGSSPTVSNSGSTSAAIFDFGIPRGADAGIKWLYDSSTSMADPGTGDIRFNNATLASVTAIAVSATGSGSDVSDYVAAWDDSTNATKAYLIIREEAGAVAAIFSVSAVTDNTSWLQLTVAYVSGSLSLTAADPLYVVPLLIGNKGSDGPIAGSVGSTDNLGVRADGTGGATLQAGLYVNDDSGNLYPATNDVGALGVTGNRWADAWFATGVVVTLGDVTLTHAAGVLTVAGGVMKLPNTGFGILDTNASHVLKIVPGSNITDDRSLTVTTGDADRTLTLSASFTVSNALTLAGTDSTTMTFPALSSTVLTIGNTATITKGYTVAPNNLGNITSFTIDPALGNYQYGTNNGAATWTAPTTDCAVDILVTNNGSAGTITFSGFTVGSSTGSTLTTTNTSKFLISIRRINSVSTYSVYALQ